MSLEDVPTWFSDSMGITLASAQVILSVVVLLSVLLPTMYLSRGSKSVTIEVVMLFLVESLLVGIVSLLASDRYSCSSGPSYCFLRNQSRNGGLTIERQRR